MLLWSGALLSKASEEDLIYLNELVVVTIFKMSALNGNGILLRKHRIVTMEKGKPSRLS